jgi:hypothetical protein
MEKNRLSKVFLLLLLLTCAGSLQAQKVLNEYFKHRALKLSLEEKKTINKNEFHYAALRVLKSNDYVEDNLGNPNAALYVAPSTAGIGLTENLRLKPATRFSIGFWIYASKPQNVLNLFGRTSNHSRLTADGQFVSLFPNFEFGRNRLPVREWVHLFLTYQDGMSRVYVNGAEKPSLEWQYDDFEKLNGYYDIGFGYLDYNLLDTSSKGFVGSVCKLAMHNAVLSYAERKAIYKEGLGNGMPGNSSYTITSYKQGVVPAPQQTAPVAAAEQRPEEEENRFNFRTIADKQAPQISFPSPNRDLEVTGPKEARTKVFVDITDKSPLYSVKVNGFLIERIPAPVNQKTSLSLYVPLEVGMNVFMFEAMDVHGNIGQKKLEIKYAGEQTANNLAPTAKKDFSDATKSSVAQSRYNALIIYVSEYEDPSLNLPGTKQDALEMAEVLKSLYGFQEENVVLLNDPDKEDLLDAFDDMEERLGNKDNLLIFYAGHGHWDKQVNKSYWLLADADKKSRSNWVTSEEIKDFLNKIQAQHVLLISDACFSGGILKTRDLGQDYDEAVYDNIYQRKSRKAITSGELETVPDNSVFLKYMVKTLRENKQRFLTSKDLFSKFYKAVLHNSPNKQMPQEGVIHAAGDEGGDFIFFRQASN